jgi:hypothetical protein
MLLLLVFLSLAILRPVSTAKISSIVGGGTAFLIHHPDSLISTPSYSFSSFEISNVFLKLPKGKLSVSNIYLSTYFPF